MQQGSNHFQFFEHDNEFTGLKWPPKSPDLNPIEHLWDVVEQELCALDMYPTNLKNLINMGQHF